MQSSVLICQRFDSFGTAPDIDSRAWKEQSAHTVGKGMPEKPRRALDGEELLEALLDFCEKVAGISSVVFHRTDFDPSVLSW